MSIIGIISFLIIVLVFALASTFEADSFPLSFFLIITPLIFVLLEIYRRLMFVIGYWV